MISGKTIGSTSSKTKLEAVSSDEFPMKAKRPAFSLLNTQKIEELGIEPIGWKKGLERLLSQINKLTHENSKN
jgi:dTDP-4-dehydrorhamnose reductase